MNRLARISLISALLVSISCGGSESVEPLDVVDAGADAAVATDSKDAGTPDAAALDAATAVEDAGQQTWPDAGPGPVDASLLLPDAALAGPDAGGAAKDAGVAGADASVGVDVGVDAGPLSPHQEIHLQAANDALASYLMQSYPAAWNIFSGANVPLGRHYDGSHTSYYTALRFAQVPVPAGATITSAKLTFYPTSSTDSANNLWINIYAEKSSNSAAFDPTNYLTNRPDQRARTTAFIDHWLVRCNATCTTASEYDCPQRKLDCWDPAMAFTVPKDLKALVQEVVNAPGWSPGNALTLLLVNAATDSDGAKYQNRRTITGYDTQRGAAFAPKLVIDFVE